MATTFVEYTGDGNATKQFTFPSYQESDVKVRVDGVLKTTTSPLFGLLENILPEKIGGLNGNECLL